MPSDLRNEDIHRIVMFGSNSTNAFKFISEIFSKIQRNGNYSDFLEKTLFIGNGEKLIEYSELAQLSEKTVADYAPVIINAHGYRIFGGHAIDLIDGSTISLDDIFVKKYFTITAASRMTVIPMIGKCLRQITKLMIEKFLGPIPKPKTATDDCFKLLSKSVDKPLFVQTYNCYGTTALKYVDSLPEKTILFTYGAARDQQVGVVLLKCNFGFWWKDYKEASTNDLHPIIQIARNFYDPKSPNFGFLTNVGVAIAVHNSWFRNNHKVKLKHEIKEVMKNPKSVAKDNLEILITLVKNNSNDIDKFSDVLDALEKLQNDIDGVDVDWDKFIFNTSIVDMSKNVSARTFTNALDNALDQNEEQETDYITSFVEKYLTRTFTYVINMGLDIFIRNESNPSSSEYKGSVDFLLNKGIDVNASEYYDIFRGVSNNGNPIVLHLIDKLYDSTLTAQQQQMKQQLTEEILNKIYSYKNFDVNAKDKDGDPIALCLANKLSNNELIAAQNKIIAKTLDKICSHENFDVHATDKDGNPIVGHLVTELLRYSKLTPELQQSIGKVLDKICSHEKFDVHATDKDGNPIVGHLITKLFLYSKLTPELQQMIEQISDKLRESSSDVNSVKGNDMCESYEHQDLSDSYLQDEVDSDPIGLSGDNTSSCQY